MPPSSRAPSTRSAGRSSSAPRRTRGPCRCPRAPASRGSAPSGPARAPGPGWSSLAAGPRWSTRPLPARERAALELETLVKVEALQVAGRPPAIPENGLRLDENPMPADRKMYLTRADIPPEGELVVTGHACLECVPKELG